MRQPFEVKIALCGYFTQDKEEEDKKEKERDIKKEEKEKKKEEKEHKKEKEEKKKEEKEHKKLKWKKKKLGSKTDVAAEAGKWEQLNNNRQIDNFNWER